MSGRWPAWWTRAAVALVRRPGLWPTALRQIVRLAPSGWWRRWPPLPRPDPAYLRFRMETAYGDPDHDPEAADVVAYLSWCRTGEWKCAPGKGRGG
ncbi:MAG TPA: hypothetical protein VM386_01300 [Acidimicrobiales bacterium]|nr:hypothetical protein [Acidimicrobiales bacterium]